MGVVVERIQWIDATRGLGIVLVVIGHVERGLVSSHIASGATWQWVDYIIYAFHMPLFFFLAGLNVPKALKKGEVDFLGRKAYTIAYPYFLWSIVQGSALIALSSVTNGVAHVSDLLRIGWVPMSQFWFLYVLMICQVAAVAFKGRPQALAVAGGLSLLGNYTLGQEGVIAQTLYSFPFFAGGILLSSRIPAPSSDKAWPSLSLFAAMALSLFLSFNEAGMNQNSAWLLPATISGIAAMIYAGRALRGRTAAIFVSLGLASMTIYILHILAAAGTRILMKQAGLSHPWLYLAICSLAGVAIPYGAHIALKKRHLLVPLGLAVRARA